MENEKLVEKGPIEREKSPKSAENDFGAGKKPLKTGKKSAKPKDKSKLVGTIVLVVGVVILLAGVGFLLFNLFKAPDVRDAEYLVSIGAWQREDENSVVWEFTEIGKGKLTTNNYTDEYDFIWAMDGDQLKIETNWLYTLDDEYTYTLDQGANTLTLTGTEKSYTFVPADTSDTPESAETIPKETPAE